MARHVWQTREADFLMMVEIGPDRLHHAMFQHLDPAHPLHEAGSPLIEKAEAYYTLLDAELGSMVALADEHTAIIVASDHGARPLQSAFCINEWLIREGYLRLNFVPEAQAPLRPEWVDWSSTRAWAEGGYYSRVFLNLEGREPRGSVAQAGAKALREELRTRLLEVAGRDGERWDNRVEAPENLYREVRGQAPDLLAIFDDLNVRALSTVGADALYAAGDDRGADACNHDWQGILVLAGAGVTPRGELPLCSIYDVGATVLSLFGLAKPEGFLGTERNIAT